MMEGLHPSENVVKKIRLTEWSEFENVIREELRAIGHHGLVTLRNVQLVTFTGGGQIDEFPPCREVNKGA